MFRSMFCDESFCREESVLANLVGEPLDVRKWRECCALAKFTMATMLGTIAMKRYWERDSLHA